MSYASDLEKKFKNNPIELITFQTGPSNYIRCTTYEKALTIDGNIYEPYPFNRGSVKIAEAFADDGIKIIVNADHPIADHYRTFPTSYDVKVTVRQGLLNDDGTPKDDGFEEDYPMLCFGWVGAYDFDTDSRQATLSIVTVGDTLSAKTLTRNYQTGCQLQLYGTKCGATVKAITLSPTDFTNGVLTLPVGWNGSYDTTAFVGGLLTFTMPSGVSEIRMAANTSKTSVTMIGSTENLSGYTAISLRLGCPHTLDGCSTLHNNSRRYGGFPYQPLENPVNKSIATWS